MNTACLKPLCLPETSDFYSSFLHIQGIAPFLSQRSPLVPDGSSTGTWSKRWNCWLLVPTSFWCWERATPAALASSTAVGWHFPTAVFRLHFYVPASVPAFFFVVVPSLNACPCRSSFPHLVHGSSGPISTCCNLSLSAFILF